MNNYFQIVLLALILLISPVMSGQDIEPPRIRWISVNTDSVKVCWEPSTTPGIEYYTVHHGFEQTATKISWDIVDNEKIYASDNLCHSFNPSNLKRDPNAQPVPFAITAHIDAIGESSLLDFVPWDSSIYLNASFDTCLSEILLNWNEYNYNMWPNGSNVYKIFISADSGISYTFLDAVAPDQHSYSVKNLNANINYSFYVAAISGNIAGDSATSNRARANTKMANIPEFMHADYATYSDDNALLNFTIDPLGELTRFNILRSVSPTGTFDSIIQITSTTNQINFTDKIDWTAGPYYYKLEAINFCNQGIRMSENTASTIVLSNSGEPGSQVLNWNAYTNWINGVQQYTVERKMGDSDYILLTNTDQNTYTDNEIQSLLGTNAPAEICYRVTAIENNNPYGNNAKSVSNELCVELPVNIRFEYDAFMPGSDSDNNTFGPKMDYLPDHLTFEILDRAGSVIFKSDDLNNLRWDGKINGKLAPAGAYMYVLQYYIGDGENHVLRGGLMVVYP